MPRATWERVFRWYLLSFRLWKGKSPRKTADASSAYGGGQPDSCRGITQCVSVPGPNYLKGSLRPSDAPFGFLKHRTALSHIACASSAPSARLQCTRGETGAARLDSPWRDEITCLCLCLFCRMNSLHTHCHGHHHCPHGCRAPIMCQALCLVS